MKRNLTYQPALDGLRAVAVLAVLCFHAGFDWARGGWLGVSTFFTLSGFLITTILMDDRGADPPVRLRVFWARRARRLLPAAWLTLAGILVFGATVADASQLARLRGDVLAALAYVANWRFMLSDSSYADLFRSPSPALHFWSLAIEEQFYVLYPLALTGLLALLARRRRALLAIVLGGAALCSTTWMAVLATSGSPFDRLYYGTDTRMAELLTGAALAAYLAGRTHIAGRTGPVVGWAGLGAAAALVALYATTELQETWVVRGGLQLVALLGALLVLSILQPDSPTSRVLAVEPLRRLGLVSYGVYLFHWPIFLWLQTEGLTEWSLLIVGGGLTIGLAAVSYRWFEQPVRHRRVLLGRDRVWLPVGATVVLVLLTLVVTTDPPEDPLALLDAAEAEGIAAPPTVPDVPGVDRPLRLLVIGDEGTDEVSGALADAQVEVTALPPTPCGGALAPVGDDPTRTTCAGWVEAWTAAVDAVDPDVTLVMPSSWDADELLTAGGPTAPALDDPEAPAWLRDRIAAGVDVLTADGGRVAVAEYPHPLASDRFPDISAGERAALAALRDAAVAHDDAELVATAEELPTAGAPGWAQGSADTLRPALIELAAPGVTDAPRVMVVGDSVSWFVGRGLERWARDHDDLVVWNTGTLGCGVARGGELQLSDGLRPSDPTCDAWADRWADQIAAFAPDQVVMLTGLWDLADRRLPGEDTIQHIGEPAVDRFLLDEYADAVEVLTAGGASLTWLNAPCYAERILPGPLAGTAALDPARQQWFNEEILPRLVEDHPEVALLDLAGHVCPDGTFTQEFDGLTGTRPDGVHFSDDAAASVADWLVPQLEAMPDG